MAEKKVPLLAGEGSILVLSADRSWIDMGGDKALITILGFSTNAPAGSGTWAMALSNTVSNGT